MLKLYFCLLTGLKKYRPFLLALVTITGIFNTGPLFAQVREVSYRGLQLTNGLRWLEMGAFGNLYTGEHVAARKTFSDQTHIAMYGKAGAASGSTMLNVTENNLADTAGLSALTLSAGSLSPVFASNITSYAASVTNTAANHVIYTMGDSITADGTYQTTLDSLLSHVFTFANLGIPGDQTPGMVNRFTSVTSGAADYVIILGGVNDIQHDSTATKVKANLQAMYTAAHNAGIKVIALTITPWKGNGGWTTARQAVQDTVNTWIASASNVDYVIDTYAALSDPADRQRMLPAYDKGDHLHPGAAGQQKMAAVIYAGAVIIPAAGTLESASTTTVTPTTNAANATIKVNGITVPSGTASPGLPLNMGQNVINTVVTAQDGMTTKTYTTTVTRNPSSNADISNIVVNAGVKKLFPFFDKATINYTLSVNLALNSMTLLPVALKAGTTIKINGVSFSGSTPAVVPLPQTSNIVSVVATAEDGITTKTYSITVTKAWVDISGNALLSTIKLSPVAALTQVTGPHFKDYTASVPYTQTSVKVIATSQDTTATIKVNGVAVKSGVATGAIALNVGANVITTVSTAQDTVTADTYTITVTRQQSTDATLSTLTYTPTITKTQVTGPDYKDYVAKVANSFTSIAVIPVVHDATATVKVNGVTVASGATSAQIPLKVGPNIINTVITAQDGITTKTYKLTVTRLSNNAELSQIKLSPVSALTLVSGPDYKDYTATAPTTETSVKVIATSQDTTATIKVNSVVVTSGMASGAIPLNVGSNIITILVTAQDGIATRTSKITITRLPSADATLATLTYTPAISKTTVTGSDYRDYTAIVANTVTSIAVIPVVHEANAKVKVNGVAVASGATSAHIPLSVGVNVINTVITAQDGITTKTYSLSITRQLSTDATLATLTFTPAITKTPGTGTDYKDYVATVANTFTSIAVIPVVHEAHATVQVNGIAVASGSTSAAIPLSVGVNVINTVITAQDGITTKTYSLSITRKAAGMVMAYEPQEQPITIDALTAHQNVSPNGDGNSDVWVIEGIAAYPENKVQIMNRNGLLVYEAKGYDNQNKAFDGHASTNGKLQQAGTYFYSLEYKDGKEMKRKTGFIVLKY